MKEVLLACLILTFSAGAIRASAAPEHLRVTVYDTANLPGLVMQRATARLRLIFITAGIELELVFGEPNADEANRWSGANIVNEEQKRRLACDARRDIALAIRDGRPSRVPPKVMGRASPFSSEGLNVLVFSDNIALVAAMWNVENSDLLAHVMAHEIGHVLLRVYGHVGKGIMAQSWDEYEYARIAHRWLFFTSVEARKMRSSLRGDGCQDTRRAGQQASAPAASVLTRSP